MQIFDFRFLMDLQVSVCPEHDLIISGKNMSVCVSAVFDKSFVASDVARELMHIIP